LKAGTDEFYQSLMQNSPVAIVFLDIEGNVITCNPAFERLFGYTREEVIGVPIDKLVAGDELLPEESSYTRRILEHGEMLSVTARRMTKGGDYLDVTMQGVPILEQGTARGVLVVYNDVSDLFREKKNLENVYSSFSAILDSVDADVYVADLDTHEILFLNRHMRESFGGDFTGRVCYEMFRKEQQPCGHCSNPRLIDESGKPTGVYSWEGQNPITGRWYRNFDRVIPWDDGRYVRLQIAFDITDLKIAKEQLEQATTHDALTGLPNKLVFDDRFRHALNVARRTGSAVAVLFVNLDGFKSVNDNLGHDCGDQLLVAVAGQMKSVLRDCDTVARMYADEFAVILEDLREPQTAERVARRLLESISTSYGLEDGEVTITASIGGAVYPKDGRLPDELLRLSDESMYAVKREGKNGVRFYRPSA
jgi:diguanylate cyclase (GGDEF)-like protein/PAS domain S-box-containing protein